MFSTLPDAMRSAIVAGPGGGAVVAGIVVAGMVVSGDVVAGAVVAGVVVSGVVVSGLVLGTVVAAARGGAVADTPVVAAGSAAGSPLPPHAADTMTNVIPAAAPRNRRTSCCCPNLVPNTVMATSSHPGAICALPCDEIQVLGVLASIVSSEERRSAFPHPTQRTQRQHGTTRGPA